MWHVAKGLTVRYLQVSKLLFCSLLEEGASKTNPKYFAGFELKLLPETEASYRKDEGFI